MGFLSHTELYGLKREFLLWKVVWRLTVEHCCEWPDEEKKMYTLQEDLKKGPNILNKRVSKSPVFFIDSFNSVSFFLKELTQ